MSQKIVVLGSTGSIGTQCLDVVRKSPDIKILGLCVNKNIALLEQQAREFKPKAVAVYDHKLAADLKIKLADTDIRVLAGEGGVSELAALDGADTAVNALTGIAGLKPTVRAIEAKKNIALANKEALVTGGELITTLASRHGVSLIPVDSEHSAIFQCIAGADKSHLKKVILTASGGPFYGKTADQLVDVTPEQALRHPNWSMGKKVTIDSATLVNKGLEVIEAHWLFGLSQDKIEVVIHPQSIIHSMVEFIDGSVIAQLALPDMRLPIAYALTYPGRMKIEGEKLDLTKLSGLTFARPDCDVFPALPLAYRALAAKGTMCAVYSGADEAAVSLYLKRKISFLDIPDLIARAMDAYPNTQTATLSEIYEADHWAREFVERAAG